MLGFRNMQKVRKGTKGSNFSSMYFWEKRHAKCLEIIGKFFSQLYTGSRRKSCLFIETTLIHLKIYTRYNILPSYFMKKGIHDFWNKYLLKVIFFYYDKTWKGKKYPFEIGISYLLFVNGKYAAIKIPSREVYLLAFIEGWR